MLYGISSKESGQYRKARAELHEAEMAENEYRGIELFSPLCNLPDLTPNGRGDWLASVRYV